METTSKLNYGRRFFSSFWFVLLLVFVYEMIDPLCIKGYSLGCTEIQYGNQARFELWDTLTSGPRRQGLKADITMAREAGASTPCNPAMFMNILHKTIAKSDVHILCNSSSWLLVFETGFQTVAQMELQFLISPKPPHCWSLLATVQYILVFGLQGKKQTEPRQLK